MLGNVESLDRIDPTGLPVGATITLPGDAITRLLRHSGVAGGLLLAKEVDYPLSNDETIALELSADLVWREIWRTIPRDRRAET